ncbi:MAG: hypothetical protein WC899_14775 [bacterium]
MRKMGRTILALAVGMLLATGIPFPTVTAVQADPGCGHGCGHHDGCGPGCDDYCKGCPGCDCECGCPGGAGQAVPPCMQDNAAAVPGGMHRMMHGKPMAEKGSMKETMRRHMEGMRGTIAKLRALESKMESLKTKDDAAAFRAASLEHSKLLTDLQESHLKHMEGIMGK